MISVNQSLSQHLDSADEIRIRSSWLAGDFHPSAPNTPLAGLEFIFQFSPYVYTNIWGLKTK